MLQYVYVCGGGSDECGAKTRNNLFPPVLVCVQPPTHFTRASTYQQFRILRGVMKNYLSVGTQVGFLNSTIHFIALEKVAGLFIL